MSCVPATAIVECADRVCPWSRGGLRRRELLGCTWDLGDILFSRTSILTIRIRRSDGNRVKKSANIGDAGLAASGLQTFDRPLALTKGILSFCHRDVLYLCARPESHPCRVSVLSHHLVCIA